MMRITVLCSDFSHPVYPKLVSWVEKTRALHNVELVQSKSELTGGEFLFLVSCSEIIGADLRSKYKHTLVLHASDLPRGRGWSPHIWEIVNGAESITLSLLEAEDGVDTGRIWLKRAIPVEKTALWYEVNDRLFAAETDIMSEALERYADIKPYPQSPDVETNYYRRRTPEDSVIDPHQTVAEQFDIIRMCDPDRYPAKFELFGQKYKIVLEKLDHE